MLQVVDYGDGTYDRAFDLNDIVRDYRHYTALPGIFNGQANLAKRKLVPFTKAAAVKMGRAEADAYEAQLTGDAPWRDWEVPYRFCSDEYVSGTATCHAYDLGADSYEVVTDAIDRYRNYYWFNNFKRDRVMFDEWGYQDRLWWRYFGFIHNAYQNWVFDQWFVGESWDFLRDDASWGIENVPWTQAVDGGLTGTAAVMESMNFLAEVIAQPEPGAYLFDFDSGYYWAFDNGILPICEGEWSFESEEWCSDVNFELGDGRHFLSIYDYDSGYYFYERLRWVGTFYDKLMALETMTNPDSFFLGVQASESFDEWAISMYITFPKELQKLFSGLVADNYNLFAGTIEETNFTYQPPNPFSFNVIDPFADAAPVDPSTSFTIQLYALWYGMAFFNANYDNRFNDTAKIWLKGAGEGFEPADPGNVLEFANPFNQRVYMTTTNDDPEMFGVGQSMISQAVGFLEQYDTAVADGADEDTLSFYRFQIETITENIEVVRGLYDLYGYLYF